MHIHPDHLAGGEHHHHHDHDHTHDHHHDHDHHDHGCTGSCHGSQSHGNYTPTQHLAVPMKLYVCHKASHAKELADLANQLEKIGSHTAYEQVMAAVSDFEKGNMRLSVVLASLDVK